MSTKQDRENTRLLNVAIAYLSASPEKIPSIKVDRDIAVRALKYVKSRVEYLLSELDCSPLDRQHLELMRNPKYRAAKEEEYRRDAIYRNQVYSARTEKIQNRRNEEKRLATIGRQVETLFETVIIGGRQAGNIWHHELEVVRSTGAFEASVCDSLLRHARPNKPTRVKDMVSLSTFTEMVESARKKAEWAP